MPVNERTTFDVLLLLARPAAGKSEIIHFLKRTSLMERKQRFHVGAIEEIDDFPMLWTWFEEDDLLSQMGKPRLHTDADGYFKWPYLWDLLIHRISLEYHKRTRDHDLEQDPTTYLVEFARGIEHGGFHQALPNLSEDLLAKAAILYIDISYGESLRKNRSRFNPNRPDSILEHGLTDEKMSHLYGEVDWQTLSQGKLDGVISIGDISVPFVVFENEDDVTTGGGVELGKRLEQVLARLWAQYDRQG